MMKPDFLIMVAGMAIVSYLPRWLPLVLLTRRQLPRWLVEWLDLIPAAIMSALVFPALFTDGDPRHLEWFRPHIFAALPTFIFALFTKSLGGTIVVGMAFFWLIEKFV
jgi:branched-subunit amino acid transport protein